MRKLKLQVQTTVDGYIAGPQGEMDFMVWNWDEALKRYVQTITDSIDCIILGRKMAGGFITHWAGVAADPDHPDHDAGKKFTETPKVVFTRSLDQSPWENTVLATDLVAEVTRLKEQDGRDIIVYGGASFVSALIREGLVDEFNLFVNPTALGDGMQIFEGLTHKQPLTLVEARPFDCGIVALKYTLPRAE